MALSNYMKRISFLDGQVLHDFHLNIMQKNISEAIKEKTSINKYDLLILVSPYNYYYSETFINEDDRDETSTADLNDLTFSIDSNSWITKLIQCPEATDEIYIAADFEDDPSNEAFVDFYYRTSEANNWIKVKIDTPIYLPAASRYLQIKAECSYGTNVRPKLYDFAVMIK